jgi:thiamine-phosphate pyrophosphorylase
MAPALENTALDREALTSAIRGGDIAALVAQQQTPGFPPLGNEILDLAQSHDIACLQASEHALNDLSGFDGAHLSVGADLDTLRQARQKLGKQALLGAVAGPTRDDAMRRGETGMDYLAFAPQAGEDLPTLELISWWCDLFVIPCVITGKITLRNAAPFIRAGADFLMLPASIWQGPQSPESMIAAFNQLVDEVSLK